MKFSSLTIVGMLMGFFPQSVLARNNNDIGVVKSTTSAGHTRHLARGQMECLLWEQDMIYQDGTGNHQWFCNFDDDGIQNLFGGFKDKKIVGLDGFDMHEFIEINGAVSGKTVLVLSGAEVYHDTIASRDIVALKPKGYMEELPGRPVGGAAAGAAAGSAEFEPAPRLKFPRAVVGAEAPVLGTPDLIISERSEGGIRGGASSSVEAPQPYTRPPKAVVGASAPGFDRHRQLAPTTGNLNTLVVRVNANDNSPPSAADLSSDIFGDEYCLKSQYDRCSYGALTIDEYNTGDRGINVQTTAVGVVDISVDADSQGNTPQTFQQLANAEAQNVFGVTNLNSLFDLVIFCMPPGMGDWLAYAFIGRWDSYYNDDWCQSLSAQMHEVGHNLALQHSGEYEGDESNQEYGDQSGMMGFSYRSDDTPKMCFNPAKNWQLGWYPDKIIDVDPNILTNEPTSFVLNGVVDYEDTAPDRYVVVKVANYYIGFNRATGFNSETREAANRVTVQQKLGTTESSTQSKLVARLNISQLYTIQISSLLEVQVRYVRNDNGKDAVIELVLNGEPIECQGEYDAELQVELLTDNYPTETSWSIVDALGQTIYGPRSGYNTRGFTFTDTVPGLCRGLEYYFVIDDTFGDGVCCAEGNGSFTGRYNGEVIFEGGQFQSQLIVPFQLPLDENPSTSDPTATPTAAPTSGPTASPTAGPTDAPTAGPTSSPTASPTGGPTVSPTTSPTSAPTSEPTENPTANPTLAPTGGPTGSPTESPTATPTTAPTVAPTGGPTASPTSAPTSRPTEGPTAGPTTSPTTAPTGGPTSSPTFVPTNSPVDAPTDPETSGPTTNPTGSPTPSPTVSPTDAPTSIPTASPTGAPTSNPTASPTGAPTSSPTKSTEAPIDDNDCVDDEGWRYRGNNSRGCDWIAAKPTPQKVNKFCNKRANNPKSDKTKVWTYCKATCNAVGNANACPVV